MRCSPISRQPGIGRCKMHVYSPVSTSLMRPSKNNGGELAEITTLIETGKVRPRIQSAYPPSEAKEAQTTLEHAHNCRDSGRALTYRPLY